MLLASKDAIQPVSVTAYQATMHAEPPPDVLTSSSECPLAAVLAARLREERENLVHRWLERIAHRVALSPSQIFPSDSLLDHVPLLLDGIADYLEDPVDEISIDVPVVGKAMELGELRYQQGFSAHQILWEYEILGGVLFAYLTRIVDEIEEPCTRGELLACAHRVFRAIAVIQQFTTDHFLRMSDERVRSREEQLRRFNRAVSHELKNRIGAAGGALSMLEEDWILTDDTKRSRFLSIASGNVAGMAETLNDLLELSRLDVEQAPPRNVLLPDAAAEVKRRLRDFAAGRNVRVDLAEELPWVEVPAAALELALSNYISNAVKYRDQTKADRWVRIEGEIRQESISCELIVRVRDNGLGVPEEARTRLFEQYFRAHGTITGEEGTGLGLSLVRETLQSVGGRAWAEFPPEGAIFAFALPLPPSQPDPGSRTLREP